jgi:hypothetical protein
LKGNTKQDHLAGLLIAAIGLAAAYIARNYEIGSLLAVGPGLLPRAVGVILCFIGILIFATADRRDPESDAALRPNLRAGLCVISGMLSFIFFGIYGGLILGTFSCVFIAALADRSIAWRAALILATAIAGIGPVVFVYFLKVPFPLFRWGLQ